jgi:uncharacterized protein
MKIVWDEPKRRLNIERHGLDFVEIDEGFFGRSVLRRSHSGRWRAIGKVRDDLICVVFAPLGREAISVISMRPAGRQERKLAND